MLRRFCFFGFIAGMFLVGVIRVTAAEKPAKAAAGEDQRKLEETAGIRISSLRLSAAGNLIDLRFKIMDAEKATSFFKEKENQPYLVDAATGARLVVPNTKIGDLKTSPKNLVAGKTSFMLFANPGGFLKQGSKVILIIGALKTDNLVVE